MTKSLRALSSIAILSALAACGGGGGSASSSTGSTPAPVVTPPSPDTPTPTTPVVSGPTRESYALVTTSPVSNYTGDVLAMYQSVNAARIGAGAGALTQNAKLDAAAAAHLNYIKLNYPGTTHSEVEGQPGYTGKWPSDRASAVGYTGFVSEDISYASGTTPTECTDRLLNSVYHQGDLLHSYRDVGLAYGEVATGIYGCVLDLGIKLGDYEQLQDAGVVKGYPFAGQTGVATTFTPSGEVPNPMPDVTGDVGAPIMAAIRGYGYSDFTPFTVSKFTLKDAAGNVVPARIIASRTTGPDVTPDPVSMLYAGEVYLVPLAPLAATTTYTVDFAGANGSTTYAKTWSFTTR
jgi:uncharacterized protein YkwD